MLLTSWLLDNWIEIFGAITGIIYVFLEIRQNLWLWPVGVFTSAVYIWIFFTGKFYADMSLQGYYLVISFLGWYWWIKGTRHMAQGSRQELAVTRIKFRLAAVLVIVFIALYSVMYLILSRMTDSPVPAWDSFITSLSIIATWMLARKIYEHWFLWLVVNSVSSVIFLVKGLYPTVILYIVYFVMSFAGLKEWKRSLI
jgi:nicotinamide mononucleotide transporter